MRIVLSTVTWYDGDEERVGVFERSVRQIGAAHEVVIVPKGGDLMGAIGSAEVFFPLSGHSFTEEVLDAAPALKWIHLASAGVDHALYPALLQRPIILTNSAGIYAIPIAEHVLAMMLALSRKIPEMVRAQAEARWAGVSGSELAESTVLIVGLGGIGSRVAARCAAFGMRVIATRRRVKLPSTGVDAVYSADRLRDALPQADWVVVCAPLTTETRHMVGPAEFALMKPGAGLINIARGGLVDEEALVDALRSGHLAGAGLDVFAEEPLPPTSPLWSQPNVIVSPHSAGSSPRSIPRTLRLFEENLRRYLSGRPLLNVVDKRAGY